MKKKEPTDPLILKMAEDRLFDYQHRALNHPKLGPKFIEFMQQMNAMPLMKAALVKGLKAEQRKIRREMDREINGLPGLFDAIEEAEGSA